MAVTKIYHGPWDEEVLVLQPIDPAAEGHIMAIPREHLSDTSSAKKFGHLCEWASKVQQVLYPGMHVNFQVNHGKHAGQTVNHLHLHIVPRREGDKLPQFFTGQKSGHYNTAGQPAHPESVRPIWNRRWPSN